MNKWKFLIVLFFSIKIVHLDYSCWRTQSDSSEPVHINKRKPVIDLLLKIDRCFTNRDGYGDPEYSITFDYFGGNNSKYKVNIDRSSWINMEKGCFETEVYGDIEKPEKLTNFKKISCN